MPFACGENTARELPQFLNAVPTGPYSCDRVDGVAGKQIAELLGLFGQFFRHGHEVETRVERGGKKKREALADRQRIDGPPRLRFVAKEAKFPRQFATAAFDVPIYAVGVCNQASLVFFGKKRERVERGSTDAEQSYEIIEIG